MRLVMFIFSPYIRFNRSILYKEYRIPGRAKNKTPEMVLLSWNANYHNSSTNHLIQKLENILIFK